MPRKKTHEEFVAEVRALVGDEYPVLSIYNGDKEKIEFKHTVCGTNFSMSPNHFLRGHRCLKCVRRKIGISKRKTHEEFVAEVRELVGDEYTVIGTYTKNNIKVGIRHNKCGFVSEVDPRNFIQGRRCGKCFGNKKKTTFQHKLELKRINPNVEVISEYVGGHSKTEYKCLRCGKAFEAIPNNLLRGSGCPFCAGKRAPYRDKFMRYFTKNTNGDYEIISKEVYYRKKIKIKHKTCGSIYEVRGGDFTQGRRCPICFGKNKKTTEEFSKEVSNTDSEYALTSEYKNARTKVVITHLKCGSSYEVVPYAFLVGNRCPKCKESKGERAIRNWLEDRRISFVPQEPIKYSDAKKALLLDFYVQGVAIEFDGEFHFKPMLHAGGEEGLRAQQERDAIKDKYCADNGIPLIRIPYWDFDNIDAILTEKLLPLLGETAA